MPPTPIDVQGRRVTIVGDSVMFDAAPAIDAALTDLGADVSQRAVGGVGVTNDLWPSYLDAVLAETDPDIVVVMLGGWDFWFIDNQGVEAYRLAIAAAAQGLSRTGAQLVWLTMPPVPPHEGSDAAHAVVNEAVTALRASEGVMVIDTAPILGDADGSYMLERPGPGGEVERLRKVHLGRRDGHMCPDGAARVAAAIVAVTSSGARAEYDPAVWLDGSWRTDPRYDDPPGACDRPVSEP